MLVRRIFDIIPSDLIGMKEGYDLLNRRTSKNALSCIFLLTDGLDGSYLEKKKVNIIFVSIYYFIRHLLRK